MQFGWLQWQTAGYVDGEGETPQAKPEQFEVSRTFTTCVHSPAYLPMLPHHLPGLPFLSTLLCHLPQLPLILRLPFLPSYFAPGTWWLSCVILPSIQSGPKWTPAILPSSLDQTSSGRTWNLQTLRMSPAVVIASTASYSSLKPMLSILHFVSQLSSNLRDKIRNWKPVFEATVIAQWWIVNII